MPRCALKEGSEKITGRLSGKGQRIVGLTSLEKGALSPSGTAATRRLPCYTQYLPYR